MTAPAHQERTAALCGIGAAVTSNEILLLDAKLLLVQARREENGHLIT